ncbi:hypothetical protein CYMTET_39237 [Cymbomonas tetramitiformis]|uniref:Uncharacterized protein n=1 Tax=Cymbomonas tetramitiformis TaxID=36881 RepID=A0AAE0CCQ2_9CHLO|nr:hypothetical protein CYMTET_39237 [Cymbomonas tetramitiformis]
MRWRTTANLVNFLGDADLERATIEDLVGLPCLDAHADYLHRDLLQAKVASEAKARIQAGVEGAYTTYDTRFVCVKQSWLHVLCSGVCAKGLSTDKQKTYCRLIALVYDGDRHSTIHVNDMKHLCEKYLMGVPRVLGRFVPTTRRVVTASRNGTWRSVVALKLTCA